MHTDDGPNQFAILLETMATNDLITAIDQAAAALQAARLALVADAKQKKPGTSAKGSAVQLLAKPVATKRVRSDEARQRMAEAQRKRWADKKKADKKAERLAKQS